jgi:hypothetical protein
MLTRIKVGADELELERSADKVLDIIERPGRPQTI